MRNFWIIKQNKNCYSFNFNLRSCFFYQHYSDVFAVDFKYGRSIHKNKCHFNFKKTRNSRVAENFSRAFKAQETFKIYMRFRALEIIFRSRNKVVSLPSYLNIEFQLQYQWLEQCPTVSWNVGLLQS